MKTTRKLFSLCLCLVIVIGMSMFLSTEVSAVDTDYYVATAGDDTTGTGTISAPFRTIAKARDVPE